MATYRLSYFWESLYTEGWSENFYWDGSTLASAQAQLDSLASQLLDLRGAGWFKMIDARVSDVSIRGNTLFTTIPMPADGTYTAPSGTVPLEANVAFYVKLTAVSPYFMRWNLRGLNSAIVTGRAKLPEATWDANFAIVLATLTGGQFQARHRLTPPPHATYSYHAITGGALEKPGARKPGRPFNLLVGARRAR